MVEYNLPASQGDVDRVLDIEGVVSVGRGVDGGEEVMVVGVSDPSLRNSPQIPGTLGGLPVVIEIEDNPGFAGVAEPPLAPSGDIPTAVSGAFVQRYRPVPPGVSIGHHNITAGTSSFIATDGSSIYQLSNNHVLALRDEAETGDAIVQPGAVDGGIIEQDKVGELAGSVPLGDTDNLVDIAWYEPSTDLTQYIIEQGPPSVTPADPEPGDTVRFVGRTSGVTEATVDRANAAIEVGEDRRRFVDQFRIDTKLQGGDSGCPVIMEAGGDLLPAGVGYASTDENGWCMYASNVISETGLDIMPVTEGGGGGSQPAQGGGVGGGVLLLGLGIGLTALGGK